MIEEYRMFFWRGKLLAATPSIQGEGPLAYVEKWEEIAGKFWSPFISMDVAREPSGNWVIIEVSDGGVSGLPESIDTKALYANLLAATKDG